MWSTLTELIFRCGGQQIFFFGKSHRYSQYLYIFPKLAATTEIPVGTQVSSLRITGRRGV